MSHSPDVATIDDIITDDEYLETVSQQDCPYLQSKRKLLKKLKYKTSTLIEEHAHKCQQSKSYITANDDIHTIPNYIACYHKGLPHNKKGLVDKKEFRKLLDFLCGDLSKLTEIKLGGTRRLVNPSCIYDLEYSGMPKDSFYLPAAPTISSHQMAADMLENYAMALVRDVPFGEWKDNKTIDEIIYYLNKLSAYQGPKNKNGKITIKNLFRGNTRGDLVGPYVSQFLYYDIPLGSLTINQKAKQYKSGADKIKTPDICREIQNGVLVEETTERTKGSYYIRNLRDGACYVHYDSPGLCAEMAARYLFGKGVPITCRRKGGVEDQYIDLGMTDILDLIAKSSKLAMVAAWHYKWINLTIRPEVFGLLVEEAKVGGKNVGCISSELLDSPLLDKIYRKFGSYCLPQVYAEGSPCHPSYPSGHATWAGAVTTILKAFFDNDYLIDAYQPDESGRYLVELDYKLRVGHELDKLASNIAIFRDAAGVHFRSDTLGLRLGEAIAIELLEETVERYAFPVKFEFINRDGQQVIITNRLYRKQ